MALLEVRTPNVELNTWSRKGGGICSEGFDSEEERKNRNGRELFIYLFIFSSISIFPKIYYFPLFRQCSYRIIYNSSYILENLQDYKEPNMYKGFNKREEANTRPHQEGRREEEDEQPFPSLSLGCGL